MKGTGRGPSSGPVSALHREGLSDPPVPCCGLLAVFTHRDGLKRVKIMLGRGGEFIEILCLVGHGTGVFKFFLA